jgi:hypothetical protein
MGFRCFFATQENCFSCCDIIGLDLFSRPKTDRGIAGLRYIVSHVVENFGVQAVTPGQMLMKLRQST